MLIFAPKLAGLIYDRPSMILRICRPRKPQSREFRTVLLSKNDLCQIHYGALQLAKTRRLDNTIHSHPSSCSSLRGGRGLEKMGRHGPYPILLRKKITIIEYQGIVEHSTSPQGSELIHQSQLRQRCMCDTFVFLNVQDGYSTQKANLDRYLGS